MQRGLGPDLDITAMATPIQDNLVVYHPGVDIIIPRGPEPVRSLQSREKTEAHRTPTRRLRRVHAHSSAPPPFTDNYNASGARILSPTEMAGRIIDTYA